MWVEKPAQVNDIVKVYLINPDEVKICRVLSFF
jgi:hypothetical protein